MSKTSYDTSMSSFLALFLSNVDGAIKINSSPLQLISEADSYWQRLLFDGKIISENRVVYNLMCHAHSLFKASVTLSFAGHTAPVPSVLRTSLESCLYAFLVSQQPNLDSIWLNRTTNDKSRSECRNAFSANKVIKTVLKSVDAELSKKCEAFYEDLIDFGAHPNVDGVFSNIEIIKMANHDQIQTHYLHGNGRETATSILSCCILIQIALQLSCHSMPQKSKEHEVAAYLKRFTLDLGKIIIQLKAFS